MTHEEIQADLSLYALDALDPDERQAIAQHLASGCAACGRELIGWQETVGAMALISPDAASPNLKSLLLQRMHPTRPPAKVVALRRWWSAPLAAAALAVLALGIVRYATVRGDLDEQRQVVAGLRSELAAARGNLQQLAQALAAKESDVASLRAALAAAHESLAVLQAPGLHLVHLLQTPEAQPAEAHALISTASRRALFYAFDLPPPPSDKAYELWWITEKEGPVNAGVFQPDARGLGRVEGQLPAEAGAIQAAAVTIEPVGGRPKPTGPMILLGKFETRS